MADKARKAEDREVVTICPALKAEAPLVASKEAWADLFPWECKAMRDFVPRFRKKNFGMMERLLQGFARAFHFFIAKERVILDIKRF